MSDTITIAVDAMGGDNSPDKVIQGISIHSKSTNNIVYKIFGDKNLIEVLVSKYKIDHKFEIFHTNEKINNDDSPLSAAKKKKYKHVACNK